MAACAFGIKELFPGFVGCKVGCGNGFGFGGGLGAVTGEGKNENIENADEAIEHGAKLQRQAILTLPNVPVTKYF
jgi:hypothetical protein